MGMENQNPSNCQQILVKASEASHEARRAEIFPSALTSPSQTSRARSLPFCIRVSPKHASHYQFENGPFCPKKLGRASAFSPVRAVFELLYMF